MRILSAFSALPSVFCMSITFALTACSGSGDDATSGKFDDSDGRSISTTASNTSIDTSGASSGNGTPAAVGSGPESITDLVLITGQSNALGTETSFDAALDYPVDRFYAYTDSGWQLASLRQVWDLGWHPRTDIGTDPHNNFGFHFGKNVVARNEQRVVGIVLVTAPGEGISHWDSQGYFYNKLRNKALAAIAALPQKTMFDAVLWHQGETDWSADGSLDPELTGVGVANDYYSQKLWQLIDNFRKDSWFAPNRPFICGETARSPVNGRLDALNRDSDPWTACVSSDNLPTYDAADVHFSAVGLRRLGAAYAEQYLNMITP